MSASGPSHSVIAARHDRLVWGVFDAASRGATLWAISRAAGLMAAAAITEAPLGVAAERKSLEDVAAP